MPNAASRSTSGRTRAERLETRVTAEQKSLIERAAALQGRTVTDFVLTSVQDAARRAIEARGPRRQIGRARLGEVDYRQLGSSGLRVSALTLGTMTF